MIFLLIMILIIIVVSSFILGYNMSESDWWEAMYTTLDDCDRDINFNHHTEDWYYGAIWAFHSITENVRTRTKNNKEN